MNNEPLNLSKKIEIAKNLAAIVLGSVGLLLFIGFCVLNSYYSKYGFSSFNLLQSRVIASGLIFVIAVIVINIRYLVPGVMPRLRGYHRKERRIVVRLGLELILLLFFAFLYSVLLKYLGFGLDVKPNTFLKLFYNMVILSLLTGYMAVFYDFYLNNSIGSLYRKQFILVIIFLMSMASIYFFGKEFYPSIPQAFGGGKPLEVQIIWNTQQNGVEGFFTTQESGTLNVGYIGDNSESYFLLLDSNTGPSFIELKKTLVGAIYYKTSPTRLTKILQ
ncbi:MAG: hypothetical protein MUP17_11970 [candidate division Zixibacteria bacterium]|nr:hypothetical protein [candidate division Zixibacteria bacterium]